jgi:hypothetical protein
MIGSSSVLLQSMQVPSQAGEESLSQQILEVSSVVVFGIGQ